MANPFQDFHRSKPDDDTLVCPSVQRGDSVKTGPFLLLLLLPFFQVQSLWVLPPSFYIPAFFFRGQCHSLSPFYPFLKGGGGNTSVWNLCVQLFLHIMTAKKFCFYFSLPCFCCSFHPKYDFLYIFPLTFLCSKEEKVLLYYMIQYCLETKQHLSLKNVCGHFLPYPFPSLPCSFNTLLPLVPLPPFLLLLLLQVGVTMAWSMRRRREEEGKGGRRKEEKIARKGNLLKKSLPRNKGKSLPCSIPFFSPGGDFGRDNT